jgi:hypothetical protein
MLVKNALKFGLTNRSSTERNQKTRLVNKIKNRKNTMKLTKPILCAAMAGTMLFAAGKASAVLGPVTISGTASYQDYTKSKDAPIIKTASINLKLILQLLAQATANANITNHPTKIYYNPDGFNTNAYNSLEGYYFYGQFYYSNSVDGLVPLDGIDEFGDYYSYVELDSFVDYDWPPIDEVLGFANGDYTEFNAVANEPYKGHSLSVTGNGVLYIHINPYDYNLPAAHMYYAGDWDGVTQQYALAIHGIIKFQAAKNGSTETVSGTITGSGDGMWYSSDIGNIPLVINGKASFSGKGPAGG